MSGKIHQKNKKLRNHKIIKKNKYKIMKNY